MTDVILLGGGSLKRKFKKENVPSKAFIEVKEKPIIEYIIDAVRGSDLIGRIVAVVPDEADVEGWKDKVDVILSSTASFTENIRQGLDWLKSDSLVLIISADIPLISTKCVEDFLIQCQKFNAELFYPIIRKEDIKKYYPETKRTYMALREGTFTGGDLGLVNPKIFIENIELVNRVFELRKNPFKLIGLLGFRFIIGLLFHTLTLAKIEAKIVDIVNAKGKAIITSYPELGLDVDKKSDLKLIRKVIT